MANVFHWVKIRMFCYATEDEEKLHEVMKNISGTEDFHAEMSDGHHGNSMVILSSEMKNNGECKKLFKRLGKDTVSRITDELDKRIDDDCTFYLRLDKQAAVSERYETAHHGDVISVTCKIVAHPARKEIAVKNMKKFLDEISGSV
ncbi:MAG: exosome protein [Methanomassiliicoccaceae archaeon]|nr:exosome protein [Methanomassiliicoccaceae archaeon]